ncbi:MAG: RsmB/NOP family class I SAM-dependent RNA methyltransferase [Promethearchaeota archaeon]|nr:MAG: RsmB/NOP family class I SAM-dependent RNA methyltransferase [Candidatus Lokiarchaeota archaeon]
MSNKDKQSFNRLLYLLEKYLDGKIVNLTHQDRNNSFIFHYYHEIIRYWNKINYILKKTLRISNQLSIKKEKKALFFYSLYRILFEQVSVKDLMRELNIKKSQKNIFSSIFTRINTFSWEIALKNKSDKEKLSITEAIPTFFIDHLLHPGVMDFNFLRENILAMNNIEKNRLYLRVNAFEQETRYKIIRDLIKDLKYRAIALIQDKEIPELYHVPHHKKRQILKGKPYLEGKIIFQDKASVAVVNILSPHPEDYIYDMCAAPGNKTSLIAQYSNNQARIIAGDFNSTRILSAKTLLSKLDASNFYLLNTDGIEDPFRSPNLFDKILLDAPCTGSGSFLTNPELKWRQSESFLYMTTTLQEKLIESAINLLNPNGILVYSVCSFYPEEGELQISKFLSRLRPLPLPDWLSSCYNLKVLGLDDSNFTGMGRLFPSVHQTQGFFIGKFKKKEK